MQSNSDKRLVVGDRAYLRPDDKDGGPVPGPDDARQRPRPSTPFGLARHFGAHPGEPRPFELQELTVNWNPRAPSRSCFCRCLYHTLMRLSSHQDWLLVLNGARREHPAATR